MKQQKGFTLLEVLIVVVIAVSVAAFSVPAYKKMQDRNRYMAAQGVLIDVGSAIRSFQLDANCSFFDRRPYKFVKTQQNAEDEGKICLPKALFFYKYLSPIPFDEDDKYKGYTIYTCGSSWDGEYRAEFCNINGLKGIAYIKDDDYAARATKGQYYGAVYLEDGTIKRVAK